MVGIILPEPLDAEEGLRQHKRRQRKRQQFAKTSLRSSICSRIMPKIPSEHFVEHLCCGRGHQRIKWEELPIEADPLEGCSMGEARGQRKRWQVESFRMVLDVLLAEDGLRVVDFGSGSGNLSLALAALYPRCWFTLVDFNSTAIQLARERASKARLQNVHTVVGRIEDFSEPFDVGIALHACGNASDHMQMQAIRRRAAYLMVPCCVGKLKHWHEHVSAATDAFDSRGMEDATDFAVLPDSAETISVAYDRLEVEPKPAQMDIVHPRSQWMCSLCTASEFMELAAGADHESSSSDCKQLVEHDRSAAAREAGYLTVMGKLHPFNCTNKNDMLIGLPAKLLWSKHVGETLIARLLQQAATSQPEQEQTVGHTSGWPDTSTSSKAERPRAFALSSKGLIRSGCCAYFDSKKSRYCSMRPGFGRRLCGTHEEGGDVTTAHGADHAVARCEDADDADSISKDDLGRSRCAYFNTRRQRRCRNYVLDSDVLEVVSDGSTHVFCPAHQPNLIA